MYHKVIHICYLVFRGACMLFLAFLFCACENAGEEIVVSPAGDEGFAEQEEVLRHVSAAGGPADEADPGRADAGTTVFVYICGHVVYPGVYEMHPGSRMYELLERCGGYTDGADPTAINQAQLLGDGEKIYVPGIDERSKERLEEAAGAAGSAGAADGGLVNINTADAATLQTINGIGASRAADIIEYREREGGFKTIEDIKKVNGIKEGLFSKIKDKIRV